MPPTDRKGTLFGGDAVHVALILQTRATARRARNALSRLLRRYHAAEPASARDRGTIVRKHISGLHRRGVSTAVHRRVSAGRRARKCSGSRYHSKEAYLWPSSPGCVHSCPQRLACDDHDEDRALCMRSCRATCGIDERWPATLVSLVRQMRAAVSGERKGSPRRATHEYAAE